MRQAFTGLFTNFSAGKPKGFTLAELLIALAILGVIAAFTIPKVLLGEQHQKWRAIGKEAATAFDAAYKAYQMENTTTASTSATHLTPYFNYVRIDTTSAVDSYNGGTYTCSNTSPCYMQANGASYRFWEGTFSGTDELAVIILSVDPDGKATGNESLDLFLTYGGRVHSWGTMVPGTYDSWGPYFADPDPPWFSWD